MAKRKKIEQVLSDLVTNGYLDLRINDDVKDILPEEWVHKLSFSYTGPSIGKQDFYYSLNMKGFEVNKALFQKLVDNWEETLEEVEDHFKELEKNIKRKIQDFENKLHELKSFEI